MSGYMLASAAALIVAGSMGVAVLGTVFFGSLSSAHPIGEALGIWRMNRPGRAG